jgi:mRNA interferase HicA
VKLAEFTRHLTVNGCRLLREGGKHSIFINDHSGRRASVPRHREIKYPTGLRICRQLGIPDPPR